MSACNAGWASRGAFPKGIVPHLGSQWWCLTRQTLSAILENPEREEIDRYFRRVWIPDESYFQTMVRQVSANVESRSLTLSKFDFQGKPHIFYDDHLQLLRRSDCFVARKIWPHADKLYATFLTARRGGAGGGRTEPRQDRPAVRQGGRAAHQGAAGALHADRAIRTRIGKTAAPPRPIRCSKGLPSCSRISRPGLARPPARGFTAISSRRIGCSSRAAKPSTTARFVDSAAMRDYNPTSFLTNLIWNTRGERQCFQFGPDDNQVLSYFMAGRSRMRRSR